MLSLDQLKKLHSDGMDYAVKNTSWFFPAISDLVSFQKQNIQNAKTLNQFMAAVSIAPPSFVSAFDVPKPLCSNCLLATTNPQYGQGLTGWFFLVGNFYLAGVKMAYNFTFVRVEIAPPGAVKLQDRNEAVRWSVIGGYGTGPSDWHTIPLDYIYMKYNKLSYSTFTLESVDSQPGEWVQSCYFKTTQPMTISFSVQFKDAKGANHSVQATQISRVPPMRNAPHALVKFGLPGLASMYWSYTDMDVTAVIDNVNYSGGKGWMDHQTFKIGGVRGPFPGSVTSVPAFVTVLNTLFKPKPVNWTWMFIQDEQTGIQYMLSANLPKGYNDNPSTFKPGFVMKAGSCNVYKDAVPYNKPSMCSDARIEVSSVQTVDGHPYPLEYKVTLPGGKKVISRAVYGLNLFPNPGGQMSCESIGVVYDETGKNTIGYSVLEINGPLSNDEVNRNKLQYMGLNPADQSALNVLNKGGDPNQPVSRKIVAWLIFLLPIILLILFLIFIFAMKDGRRIRFALSVAIAMIMYVVAIGITMSMPRRNNVLNNNLPTEETYIAVRPPQNGHNVPPNEDYAIYTANEGVQGIAMQGPCS